MKALFLDRDGIINRKLPGAYVRSAGEFEFLPTIVPIIQHAQAHGYLCIVISNQQGVGKNLMSVHDLDLVTEYMQQCLVHHHLRPLDAVYYCTHLDGTNSTHRKPAPGMLLDALATHSIHPSQSWFLGDSLSDAEAGKGAGVHTALVGDYPAQSADIVAISLNEMVPLLRCNLR